MNLALFTVPARKMDIRTSADTLLYAGQKKRATFDKNLDVANADKTVLYVFEKNPKHGWAFIGMARVVRNVSARTNHQAPVWELRLEKSDGVEYARYTNKSDILSDMGIVSKYKNLALGIIPLM